MVSDAIRYTSAYRNVSEMTAKRDLPIMMAGHQPSLFHSGVWFKNFALSHLASENSCLAINLVIDNDVASGSSIRVPSIDPMTGRYRYQVVRYDRFGGGVPYEQTVIRDRQQFDRFDREVLKAVLPIVQDPSVVPLWKHAREAVERCGVAGCALAQARHALEGEIGLSTLELPLGVLCRSTAFAQFTAIILQDLPRFQNIYNSETTHYRDVHGIRSHSHPVPNLMSEDQWYEAPIWIYSDASPTRRSGWIKRQADQLIISDRKSIEFRVADDSHGLIDRFVQMNSSELKIRPRALLTTMYARLVLSDLFLHGIGGGKYDQLGDRIARRFFEIEPPQFMVVSATVRLPGRNASDWNEKIRQLHRVIRDTQFQGERFLEPANLDADLVEKKRLLIAQIPDQAKKPQWHRELTNVNEKLQSQLIEYRGSVRAELAEAQREQASQAILKSREHPFCIFSLQKLCSVFSEMLSQT